MSSTDWKETDETLERLLLFTSFSVFFLFYVDAGVCVCVCLSGT